VHSNLFKMNKTITIRVGYDWSSDENGKNSSSRWSFIRGLINKTIVEINKRQKRLQKEALNIRLARMRAIHGGEVLGTFVKRCKESDILVFDISTENPNVMFELGLAIATKERQPCIYIFHEQDGDRFLIDKIPSDLRGYFITTYRNTLSKGRASFRLVDHKGFTSSLIARIRETARNKGLMVDKPGLEEEQAD